MHDAISVEDLHRPAVVLANEGFVTDGRSASSNKGMPAVRIVAEAIPCECGDKEEVDAGVKSVIANIIDALMKPLLAEEAAPKTKEKAPAGRIHFKGQLDEFNRFFYKRGWGDGLPLNPPTEAAVREMLAATELSPEHVVAKLPPRNGKATVEKIAINAVMGGALPTHMPVLIACVEALADPRAHLGTYGTSTGSWMPFWIVNGPVRGDLRVNSGTGAMSPGDIANAAIGRTIGLLIKNIGGARKGVEDMGVYGNPGKYACLSAENEEGNPWDPLHVEQGFSSEDSTVTLFFPNSYTQIWQYGSDDQGILATYLYNLPPGRNGLTCLLMTPAQAKTLAKNGWSKAMIQKYVHEYARVPAYRHPKFHDGGGWTMRTPDHVPPNAMDAAGIVPSPEHLRVVVLGGPGAFMGFACGGNMPGAQFVTKKITFPSGWSKLVAKYKNLVPSYERY